MTKYRIFAVIILLIGLALGYFVYSTETATQSKFKFKYGLDLNGGTHLVYRADTSGISSEQDISKSMDVLRQTIEKRVNKFGVSEPIVQTETGSSLGDSKDKYRLAIDLPGEENIDRAIASIGKTPFLEFKLLRADLNEEDFQKQIAAASTSPELLSKVIASAYQKPVLTGGHLKRSTLVFDPTTRKPLVSIEFNSEGTNIFEQITADNIGKELAIFLDGELISNPVIQQKISGGQAQINGDFTAEEGRDLVNNLNFGALPLPIELINTQLIGSTLGQHTLEVSAQALLVSLIVISIFMILFYRLPGVVASIALVLYTLIMLSLFKFIPVVLTAAGIAGFVLSLGIAVDANVLIFERIREELERGRALREAISHGFDRAWTSIRDGNITSIIAAVILYWFSDVSLIKGFALVFGMGVIMSMVSAVLVSKTLLLAISKQDLGKFGKFLYSKGLHFRVQIPSESSITSNTK
jgi:preprotein translocase subunit SecD